MKYKKPIIGILILIVAFCAVTLVTQPLIIKSIYARFKSTDHFQVFENDQRIRYEDGSERNAEKVAVVLSETASAVESILNSTFKKPINIFICETQDSFNEYVFLSRNVRGAVYWGKLFLSPGAFNRDSLDNLLEHELTHYLFYTHLGEKSHIRNIPLWFREGIAVFVANNVNNYAPDQLPSEQLTSAEKSAFLSDDLDYWFYSKNPLDAVTTAGTANATLYRTSALVVQHIHDNNAEGFNQLIQLLLSGSTFETALNSATNYSTESLLNSAKEDLKTSNN